jgi:hypothetical protein
MMTMFRELAHGLGIILIVVTPRQRQVLRRYRQDQAVPRCQCSRLRVGNKADRGICILRTASLREASRIGAHEHMVLHFDKNKDEEVMGQRGTVACVFDTTTMTLTEHPGATTAARRSWS